MNPYILLVCPSCGGKTNVRNDEPTVTCQYCGNDLVLQPELRIRRSFSETIITRPEAPMPDGLTLKELPTGFLLTRRWFSWIVIFQTFFVIFWDGFLIFWYGSIAFTGAPLPFLLFPLIHVAVGVFLTYSTLAGYLNKTYIELEGDTLIVEHYPLPWFGNKRISIYEIQQLYTREVIRRSKNGSSRTYTLSMVKKDGKRFDLVNNLPDPESSFFMEQQIEKHLNIPDEPVAGELPR